MKATHVLSAVAAAGSALVLVTGILGSCSPNPHVARPPARYQGDALVMVHYVSDPRAVCLALGAVAGPGKLIRACHHNGVLVLLNPCITPPGDVAADDACHEKGHFLGWAGSHPK